MYVVSVGVQKAVKSTVMNSVQQKVCGHTRPSYATNFFERAYSRERIQTCVCGGV